MSRLQEDFWEQVSKPYGYERADDDKGAQTRFGGPGGGHESLGHDRLCAKELFAPDKRRKNAEGKGGRGPGTMSRLQEDFWEQVSKPYGMSKRMTTRALKRDLAALEEDMSPVTLASKARMPPGRLTPVVGMSRSGIAGRAR